jgi:hypothetical protein
MGFVGGMWSGRGVNGSERIDEDNEGEVSVDLIRSHFHCPAHRPVLGLIALFSTSLPSSSSL